MGSGLSVGALRERVAILNNVWPAITISSITRVGIVATATTVGPHGFLTNDYVTISGANQVGYNGRVKVTVIDPATFSYTVDGAVVTPATGAPAAVYTSDAEGGRRANWVTLDTVWAEVTALSAREQLQLQAIEAKAMYQVQIRRRVDVSPTMRLLWTPSWPPNSPAHTLEIDAPLPDDDLAYMNLSASEVVQ